MKLTKETTVEDVYYECGFSHKEELAAVVFQALCWFNTREWTKKKDALENIIKELIKSCLRSLREGRTGSSCSSGGLCVELNLNEDAEIEGELKFEL